MKRISRIFRSPKRMAGMAAIGGLALVIAGCSPGTLNATVTGSITNPADKASFNIRCLSTPRGMICLGAGAATIDGQTFRAVLGTGGFITGQGTDCTVAPCPDGGQAEISGLGYYMGKQVQFTLSAEDFDNTGVNSPVDGLGLVFSPKNGPPISRDFPCDECVEITLLPGTVTVP
ncbi:MAG: hypothetical protein ACRDFX_10075 [Chloroflexota bacterium]